MDIAHPHWYLFVSTLTGIVTVLWQAQRVTHLCKGSHPHNLTSPMLLSSWSPYLPVPPTYSHTHRVLSRLSANLEIYAADHNVFEQGRQVRLWPPSSSCPSLNSSCQCTSMGRPEFTFQFSLVNLFDLPEPQFFSSTKWNQWSYLHRDYQDVMS